MLAHHRNPIRSLVHQPIRSLTFRQSDRFFTTHPPFIIWSVGLFQGPTGSEGQYEGGVGSSCASNDHAEFQRHHFQTHIPHAQAGFQPQRSRKKLCEERTAAAYRLAKRWTFFGLAGSERQYTLNVTAACTTSPNFGGGRVIARYR